MRTVQVDPCGSISLINLASISTIDILSHFDHKSNNMRHHLQLLVFVFACWMAALSEANWFSPDTKATVKSAAAKVSEDTKSNVDDAKSAAERKAADTKNAAAEAKAKAERAATDAMERAKEARTKAEQKVYDAKAKAEQKAYDAKAKTERAAAEVKDRSKKVWNAAKGEYTHVSLWMRIKQFFSRD